MHQSLPLSCCSTSTILKTNYTATLILPQNVILVGKLFTTFYVNAHLVGVTFFLHHQPLIKFIFSPQRFLTKFLCTSCLLIKKREIHLTALKVLYYIKLNFLQSLNWILMMNRRSYHYTATCLVELKHKENDFRCYENF